eukprot:symbB.v1.2.002736.t1/scaffold146.1/size298692/17
MEKPGKYAEFIGKDTTWDTLFAAREKDIEMFQDQVFYQEAAERVPAWLPVFHSHAGQLIAELMGSAKISFFYLHAILKQGGAKQAIPWHQDLPYWKVDGKQIGSVWIALDDMPLAASVRYVQGSHVWGLFRPQHFVDHSSYEGRDDLPLLPDVDAMLQQGKAKALAFEVKAGDALCFDARIVHGSLGNSALEQHRRVALRFGGEDAVYCDRGGETAIPTPEIDAVHGLRDGEKLSCKVQWHFCSVQVTHWFPGTLARLFRKCGREKDSQTNNAFVAAKDSLLAIL